MSCSCCSRRQPVCHCEQFPCLSTQGGAQIQPSPCHAHTPQAMVATCGCHYHHTPSQTTKCVTCAYGHGFTPGHTHQYHHPHPPPSSLCCPSHQPQPGPSAMAIVQPHKMEPPSIHQLPPPSPTKLLSHSHQEPGTARDSQIRLKATPLCRPHPPHRLHSSRPHPQHREQLLTSDASLSNGKSHLPMLEFSPATMADILPTSDTFKLGLIERATQQILEKKQDAPAALHPAHDETINYSRGVGTAVVSKTEQRLQIQSTSSNQGASPAKTAPPTTSAAPPTSAAGKKPRTPILLYKWSFKVMAEDMVVLLGYRSQNADELKWRSGPISGRVSASLMMTKSGQLYHLMGQLNADEMAKDSPQLTKQLLKKFRKGFPTDWTDLLRGRGSSCAVVKKTKPPVNSMLKEKQSIKTESVAAMTDLSRIKREVGGEGGSTSRKVKIKLEVSEEQTCVKTPELSQTPMSDFVSSLKRSSRGRVIKPARSTFSYCYQSCGDLYSYDWQGNFTGINSFIDLTGDDDPLPKKMKRRIKQESMDDFTSDCSVASTSTHQAMEAPKPASSKEANREVVTRRLYSEDSDDEASDTGRRQRNKRRGKVTIGEEEGESGLVGGTSQKPRRGGKGVEPSDDKNKGGQSKVPAHKPRKRQPLTSTVPSEMDDYGRQGQRSSSRTRNTAALSSTSEDSDTECRQLRPEVESRARLRPDTSTRGRGQKISETGVLTMSDVAAPSRGRKTSAPKPRYHVQTLASGDGNEILTNSDNERRELTGGDLRRLGQIVHSVPATTSHFWEVVAKRLGTGHTANQCCEAYLKLTDGRWPQTAPGKEAGGVAEVTREIKKKSRSKAKREGGTVASTDLAPVGRKSLPKMKETSVLENMSGLGRPSGRGTKEAGSTRVRNASYHVSPLSSGGGQEILGDVDPIQSEISLRELRQIVHSVPALTGNFWEVVARKLGTGHTAHQCSTAYHSQQNKMKPPATRPKRREKEKVASETTITAKTGTLKRKRQLRDALENLDSGYVDDIFDSTPFKKVRKSVKIPETHDDYFDDEENVPCSLLTPLTARDRVGAPSSRTPQLCDYLSTPDLKSGLKRDVADHVIYKAQKANRAGRKTVTFKQPSTSKSLVCEQKLHNIRTGELTTLRMFEDSDDTSSDESNPFDEM